MYFFSAWKLHHLEQKKMALAQQSEQAKQKFFQAKSKLPGIFFVENTAQSLEKIQQEIQLQEKLLSKMVSQLSFSQSLDAFSRTIVPNVWLTDILITKNGTDIILRGKSINTSNLQSFITNLTKEKLFSNYALNVKNIEDPTPDKSTDTVLFEIELLKKNT